MAFGLHLQTPPPLRHRIDKLSLVNRGDAIILTEFKLFPRSNLFPPAPLRTNKWDLGESNKSDSASIVLFFIFKRSPPSPPPLFPFIFSRGKSLAQREEADGGGEAV